MAKDKKTTIKPALKEDANWFTRLSPLKKDIVCVVLLYIVVVFLFHDVVFKNMIFGVSDNSNATAWAHAGKHLEETEHQEPLWIPYAFSGMPGAASLGYTPHNVNYLQTIIGLPGKLLLLNADLGWFVWQYFLGGVFMFLLARGLKFPQVPSLLAALTFMMNPNAISLIENGQGSKFLAMSYIPIVFLLTYNLLKKRDVLSFGLLSAAVGTMLLTDHVQMAFYGLLIIGLYVLYEIVLEIKQQPVTALKNVSLFGLAIAIAFMLSAYIYLSTYEYSQYSIRGGGDAGVAGGLDYDYATGWSFHPFETMNFIIPSFFGFSSEYVMDWQGQPQIFPLYWGWMPFTVSTVYIGLLPIIFSIIALMYRRNRMTIFLAAISFLFWVISFGNHLPILFNLFFNYMPYFNKFRIPAMILQVLPVTLGLLAAYGVSFIMELPDNSKEINIEAFKKRLKVILGALVGLLAIVLVAKSGIYSYLSTFMFVKEGDLQRYGQQALDVFKERRFDVLISDYIKFTVLAAIMLGLIIAYLNRKIRASAFGLGLIAVLFFDLYILDVKYIDPKPQTDVQAQYDADSTINFLKNDTSFYRVYPIGDLFRDGAYLYMYNDLHSISGYSPAKLKIYQEMIDSVGLYPPRFPLNLNVVNMLNAKYIIAQGRLPGNDFVPVHQDPAKGLLVYQNPGVFPHAWFVDTAIVVSGKRPVFDVLNSPSFNARHQAILEKTPSAQFTKADSSDVSVTTNLSSEIDLSAYTSKPSLLVLSEVYYPAGWKAYIDGNETEIYKTNYVLRSIVVPQGKHSIKFKFNPVLYTVGSTVTNVGWGVITILLLIGFIQLPAVRKRIGMGSKTSNVPEQTAP